jgi:GNAT superfamily N-acetyltransferase
VSELVQVRTLDKADYANWLELWDGYNAFYGREGATVLAPAITAMTWQRFFDSYEPVYGMVAVQGTQIVGLVHYLLHRSTTAIEPSIYLQDLFTTVTARGKGVGRQLIEAVYAHARDLACSRVYWQTHETNATAMKLYDRIAEKSGFVVYRKLVEPSGT